MSVLEQCKARIAGWLGKAKPTKTGPTSAEDPARVTPPTPGTGDASGDDSN